METPSADLRPSHIGNRIAGNIFSKKKKKPRRFDANFSKYRRINDIKGYTSDRGP